jgi:hypothetical protein
MKARKKALEFLLANYKEEDYLDLLEIPSDERTKDENFELLLYSTLHASQVNFRTLNLFIEFQFKFINHKLTLEEFYNETRKRIQSNDDIRKKLEEKKSVPSPRPHTKCLEASYLVYALMAEAEKSFKNSPEFDPQHYHDTVSGVCLELVDISEE